MASFVRASTPAADVLGALAPLSADPSHAVAAAPMDLVITLGRWLEGDPLHAKVETYAGALYAPAYRALGWEPKKGETEPSGRTLLRQAVIDFLAFTARDKAVRREAAARGRAYLEGRPEAVSPELTRIALQVAAEEGGAPFFDALVAALAGETRELPRRHLLAAIGSALDPALAARARALELDPRVRVNEVTRILDVQLRRPETRDAAWAFLTANVDKLLARIPVFLASRMVSMGTSFCDRAHKDELENLFAPRIAAIEAGPRSLAGALEQMSLCVARRSAQEPSARAFFAGKKSFTMGPRVPIRAPNPGLLRRP